MVSLNRRFHMVFLLLLALPLMGVFLWMSWLSMEALQDTASTQTQVLMGQVAQSIENEVNAVSVLAAALVYDRELEDAAEEWTAGHTFPERAAATWKMTERLESILTVTNRFGAIALYLKDGTILPVSNYPNIRSFFLADKSIYQTARAQPNQVVIADSLSGVTMNGGGRFILSALICPAEAQGGRAVDAVLVMFRLPYLDQFTTIEPSRNARLLILGRDGRTLVSDLPGELTDADRRTVQKLPAGDSKLTLSGRSYLVNARALDLAQWTLVLATDKASITSQILRYLWYLFPVLLVMFGLFLVYSRVFFSRVTQPINQVIDNMRRFASGLELRPVPVDGIQELAALSATFDSMVAEISRLEAERRQQSDQRLSAEIRALQFQINPHFVANTLNAIRMMALAARNDSIRDMTQALIRILADSYAGTDSLTDLASEVENLKNYLYIMKVRYGEHFQVNWDLDSSTLGCRVLRMGLQPLVENAILHGFAGLSRQGLLTIRSFQEDPSRILVLEVIDNGVGIDPARAQELLKAPGTSSPSQGTDRENKFNRIGVRNVHDRIRLHFGPDFGLHIDTRLDEGTRVQMRIPFLREV